jgi:riboflavin kinase/FMN adenylyltransferase
LNNDSQVKIYHNIDTLPFIQHAAIAVGTFDGVHQAHRVILNRVSQSAKDAGGQSVIISFSSHPRKLISADFQTGILTTQEEKNKLIAKEGIDNLLYFDFTQSVAAMHYRDFIEFLSRKIHIRTIVVGYNHNFGKNREGTIVNLRKIMSAYGFDVVEIGQQTSGEIVVSSSAVREAMNNGNLTMANQLLGYQYELQTEIVSYCDPNRLLVVPAVKEKIIPKDGTYPVEIDAQQTSLQILHRQLYLDIPHSLSRLKDNKFLIIKFLYNRC